MDNHPIYSVKADTREGVGFVHVYMTYDKHKARKRQTDIKNDHSLGIIRLAIVVRPKQWVVDAYLAVGNSIED